ncbi:MAG: replicative DNA helicase [Treponema sp.]|nr:replicative DNA helicase [Treponema sp.]
MADFFPGQEPLKDTIPPHDVDAEQAMLGAMLLDWNPANEVVSELKIHGEDFYLAQNRIIFNVLDILGKENVQVDAFTLIDKLKRMGELEKVGGEAYIATLTNTVPSSANIKYYAKLVLDKARRRSLIKISSEIKSSAFEFQKESRFIIEDAEKKIFALADADQTIEIHNMQDIVNRTIENVYNRVKNHGDCTGVTSGFTTLDSMTSGFQNSEFVVIGARPSMGKTALALNMMEHISIDRKIPCGFFSLEMSYEQIGQRLLSQRTRIPGTKLRNGMMQVTELQKLQDAASACYEAPLYIVDTPNMQLVDLRTMARRLVHDHGVQIIFIDYIGLITVENVNAAVYEQVSEISKSLKSLARELNIPIVALCQVARSAEGEEPNLAQLRGSGSIEQDADVVMFIHRERKKSENGEMEAVQDAKLIVAKQRNGPIGDVPLLFLNSVTRFENKVGDGESVPV